MNESIASADQRFMRIAIQAAWRGQGMVEPNPMVGCVLVRDGQIVGQGHHAKFGGPHTEIAALQSLSSQDDAKGATAYVTLEPCCHHGKTPPCATALIGAGIVRVVVAKQDPFPRVDGGGLWQLSDAGVEVSVGVLADEAAELVAPFAKVVQRKRPWVTAKWAMTIDGRIATVKGESQWITGEASRAEVHKLRARVDAIVVGMGTVVADDPLLTARPAGDRIATRVVFCNQRLPSVDSQLIQTARQTPVLLVVSDQIDESDTKRLSDRGVSVLSCGKRCDMVGVALDHLGTLGMTNVMLEGGGELLGSFLTADELDECHVYVGSKLFGGSSAPGPVGGDGIARLIDANAMRLRSVDAFDDDVRMIYRRVM